MPRINPAIVALSSPPGGTLAILRLSGPNAARIADSVFKIDVPETPRNNARPGKAPPKIYRSLSEAASEKRWLRLAGNVTWRTHTLPAHAYVMPTPRSYTRED